MTKMRLEKVGLNKYLKKLELSPTDLCEQCISGKIEDVRHYLTSCQKYNTQREKLYTFMRNNDFRHITVKDLLGSSTRDIDLKKRITLELGIFISSSKRLDTL